VLVRAAWQPIYGKSRLNWKLKISNVAYNAGITQSQTRNTRCRRMQEVNSLCTDSGPLPANTVLCSFYTMQPSSIHCAITITNGPVAMRSVIVFSTAISAAVVDLVGRKAYWSIFDKCQRYGWVDDCRVKNALTTILSKVLQRTGVIEIGPKSAQLSRDGILVTGLIEAFFHWRGTEDVANYLLNK